MNWLGSEQFVNVCASVLFVYGFQVILFKTFGNKQHFMIQTSISSKQHIYILYYSVSFLFTQAEESSPHSVTLGEDTCFLLQFF